MAKQKRVAVFFGGKITKHLVLVRKAARKLGVEMDLFSYNKVSFDTSTGKVRLNTKNVNDYDVLFFRTTGKHWEEANLILDAAKERIERGEVVVVDPLVLNGRPSDACKAYQMLALSRAGIDVPRTIYGSLWYLYEFMKAETEKDGASEWRFPVIVKGSGGDRGTRVFKADNLEELEKLVRELRRSEII